MFKYRTETPVEKERLKITEGKGDILQPKEKGRGDLQDQARELFLFQQ